MELSKYIKAYPFKEKEGYVLLFSTKNASKVLVKEDTYKALKEGVTPAEKQALLSKLGMVVPDPVQEKRDVLTFFDRYNQRNREVNITAVVNMACNFACPYCYEGKRKGSLYMSPEIAESLVSFARKTFSESKKSLLVDFYGGEPLLSVDLIKSISTELKLVAEQRDGSYRFTLVTNGSLFKRSVAQELVPLGLDTARITLDGPAEVHNRYRPFRSGRGSFDTIIRNIKDTCDLVKVIIGGNYERDNYRRFPLLLDFLLAEGLTPGKIAGIKFDPVNRRPEGDAGLVDYDGGCRSINEPWLAEASTFLREEILKRGYATPKAGPILCMVEQKDSFVVSYDGTIYKCPAFLGREEFTVGNVHTGIDEYAESHKLDNWKNEECAACAYLPLCYGGCRYATFAQGGALSTLDCKKEYFDACLEGMVNQDVRYRSMGKDLKPTTADGRPIDIATLTGEIDRLLKEHFPEEYRAFIPPTLEKIISCYRNADMLIQTYVHGIPYDPGQQGNAFSESGLVSAAMIRYADDFVDRALWPRIGAFDPAQLEARFEVFLKEAVKAMREFDPDLPDSIADLLLVEMHLALHPDQETFDRNFENLFRCKSFDLYYVYQKIHGGNCVSAVPKHLMRVALMDYLRDFSEEAIATDTDLNLYAFLRDHKLSPRKLLEFLIATYKGEDPDGFCAARDKGLFNGIEGVDLKAPAEKTEIPLHEHFSKLFARAIIMLRELL